MEITKWEKCKLGGPNNTEIQFPFIFIRSSSINRLLSSILSNSNISKTVSSLSIRHIGTYTHTSAEQTHTLGISYRPFADEYLSSIIQMKQENAECRYTYRLFAFPSLPVERRLLRKHICVHREWEWALNNCSTKYIYLNRLLIQLMLAARPQHDTSPRAFFFFCRIIDTLAERSRDFAESE